MATTHYYGHGNSKGNHRVPLGQRGRCHKEPPGGTLDRGSPPPLIEEGLVFLAGDGGT
jgi:hypothetical protein